MYVHLLSWGHWCGHWRSPRSAGITAECRPHCITKSRAAAACWPLVSLIIEWPVDHPLRLSRQFSRLRRAEYSSCVSAGAVDVQVRVSEWVSRGLTSHSTHYSLYRSFRGRFLQVRWPNQQCKSTEGSQLATEIGFNPTRTTPLCYNMNCRQPPLG